MEVTKQTTSSQEMDECYTQPISECAQTPGEDDSGIHTLGRVNHSYIPADCEMESSFSDELNVSSKKPYDPNTKRDHQTLPHFKRSDSKELSLPPPPGNLWLPVGQPHSADGVITGGYPSLAPPYQYVQSSTLQPPNHHSMRSIESSGGITSEEYQLILKFRQDQIRNKNRGSSSPEEDGRHFYEELPGYQYKTHSPMKSLPSPMERRARPHLPPVDSLPSSSQGSGLDKLHEEEINRQNHCRPRKDNPLYEVNESPTATKVENKATEQLLYADHPSKNYCSRRKCRCYSILILLIALTAAAALSISLISFLGIMNTQVPVPRTSTGALLTGNFTDDQLGQLAEQVALLMTQAQKQGEVVEQLTGKLNSLEREKSMLETQLGQIDQNLHAALNVTNNQLGMLGTTLQTSQGAVEALSYHIDSMNTSLTEAVESVSKMPGPVGPQGPAGLLNTSLCHHSYKQYPTNGPYDRTISTGSITETASVKVMAASCSWQEYGGVMLDVTESDGYKSYRCRCSRGLQEDLNCRLDYWICTV
ncbi:uncharacterized protein [Watersipora subatra]|uniref:uncharacterized protein isoform X2 n=1 Tax=Watersipora subatra TaxID=2589382 RepID=UPI00355BAF65